MWGLNDVCIERARFIGRDGSCGYSNGKEYRVTVRLCDRRIFVNDIPYGTFMAVNKNWKFLGV